MKPIGEYWRRLAPREQWLALGIGLFVAFSAWYGGKAIAMVPRIVQAQADEEQAAKRAAQAKESLKALQKQVRNGSGHDLVATLREAEQRREDYLKALEDELATLASPQQMTTALMDILRSKPRLRLLSFENTVAPFEPQLLEQPKRHQKATEAEQILYWHGIRMTVSGSYFDVHDYLKSVEQSGQQLFWGHMECRVEDDHKTATVTIDFYTLSREAGLVGALPSGENGHDLFNGWRTRLDPVTAAKPYTEELLAHAD